MYGKQRSFQEKWMKEFPWLTYSISSDGALCKYCCLFGKSSLCGKFITELWTMYHKGLSDLRDHNNLQCHKESKQKAMDFVSVMQQQQSSIDVQLNNAVAERIANNRKILHAIIDTIILCGRQNLALRGHADTNKDIAKDPDRNPGNFMSLLNFRARSGDENIAAHLTTHAGNASYTSKKIQNELIAIIGQQIQHKLVKDIKDATFFSISADEAADVSNKEQLSVVIRYVNQSNEIQETFMQYVDCDTGTTGRAIADKLLETINSLGLTTDHLRGQSYDGAGNMSGKLKGASTLIKEVQPKAVYIHCNSHQLNLCVMKSCKVLPVSNMMALISEVSRFFNHSPKRQDHLELILEQSNSPIATNRTKLLDVCRTRWIERYDAMEVFLDLLPIIVETFEDMTSASGWNKETVTTARSFVLAITQFEFLFTVVTTSKVLGVTKGLCRKLQSRTMDIISAYNEVSCVRDMVASVREDIDTFHGDFFEESVDIANALDVEVKAPRRCGRQTLRNNAPADSPTDYYKRNVTIPLVDHLDQELRDRFSSSQESAIKGMSIVPVVLLRTSPDIKALAKDLLAAYDSDIPERRSLELELKMWERKWKAWEGEAPKSPQTALEFADQEFFPNIRTILRLVCTIPVTSCENERSFSALRRLKTWLRSSMTNERLNGLALMNVHYRVNISIPDVIDQFSRDHCRRMQFMNILCDK